MRKITFLLGAAAGFVVGSRCGTGPYEQLEGKVREILGRDDVQQKVGDIKGAASQQASSAAHAVSDKVSEKLPGSSSGDGGVPGAVPGGATPIP
jgi:hypothetical protein